MRNWISKKWNRQLHSPKGFSCGDCQKPKRCCDFSPFVPNFLAGRLDFELIRSYRVTPLGLFPIEQHPQKCDFFAPDSKTCRVWEHRPAECASYFCESFDGAVETQERSRWLSDLEFSLAQWIMMERGFSHHEIAAWVDCWNVWAEEGVRKELPVWPAWLDEPRTYFSKCAESLMDFDAFTDLPESVRLGFDKHLRGSYGVAP